MNSNQPLPTDSDITTFTKYQQSLFSYKADGGYPTGILSSHKEEHAAGIAIIMKHVFEKDVTGITELSRRTLHYVYNVATDTGSYIVRINASGMFCKELQYYIDQYIADKLTVMSLPAPKVYAIDLSRTIVPFDYEVMEVAKGRSLYDLVGSGADVTPLVTHMGTYIATVHGIPAKLYGLLDPSRIIHNEVEGVHKTWASHLTTNLDHHLEYITMAGVVNVNEADAIRDMLKTLTTISCDQPVFLHGDVANHNTFTDGNAITGIIDWEDALSGDPVFDIAYYATGCYENDTHNPWLDAFIGGYTKVRQLPEDYEKRFWAYYLRIAVAKAIIRFRYKIAIARPLPDVSARIRFGLSKLAAQG